MQSTCKPSGPGKSKWSEHERAIIEKLDIEAEYAAMGAQYTSGVNESGWRECWGIFDGHRLGDDNEDHRASAAVNVAGLNGRLGQYTDLGQPESAISFFEAAGRKLFNGDFRKAREHFSQKVGVALPSANGRAKKSNGKKKTLALDQLNFIVDPKQVDPLLLTFIRNKAGIELDALRKAKPRVAQWTDPYYEDPCDQKAYTVVVLEARRHGNDTSDPDAILMYRDDGKPFPGHGKQKSCKMRMLAGSKGKESIFSVGDWATAKKIYYCEGAPDAISITPHLPAGAVAVSGCIGARCPDAKSLAAVFHGKAVVIFPDTDEVGMAGGRKVAEVALRAGASEVKIVPPPAGKDVRDMVAAGKVADLLQAIEAAQPETEKSVGLKPQIALGLREDVAVAEAIAALASGGEIYQRGGRLVYVTREPRPKSSRVGNVPGGLRIANLPKARLRTRLTAIAEFFKSAVDEESGEMEETPTRPSPWLVNGVFEDGEWDGILPLIAVSEVPVLLPSGEVLQKPGFDADHGIYYDPKTKFPPIPDRPTKDDAVAAVARLLDVVSDFPFVSDVARAAYLAAILTPIARNQFDAPCPLFAIDSNVAGTGKGKLATVIGMVATGRRLSPCDYSSNPEEMRKTITSIALDGAPAVLLDNIHGTMGCSALDAALTGTTWTGRLLGKNEMIDVPLTVTWYATGNNLAFGGDLPRRVLVIQMESKEENPEGRMDFKQPHLDLWLAQHWPSLFVDALTFLRAFEVAGQPQQSVTPWGSFDIWELAVRQAVLWAFGVDPAGGRIEAVEAADLDKNLLQSLMAGWAEMGLVENLGMSCREIFDGLNELPAALKEAIANVPTAGRGREPGPRDLGYFFRRMKGRVVGGRKFVCQLDRTKVSRWHLVGRDYIHTPQSNAGDAGDCR